MSQKSSPRPTRGSSNADLRQGLAIVAFGLFALVIVLLVFFPQLRPGQDSGETISVDPDPTKLLILAASSLTKPLSDASRAYELTHPEWRLDLSFAASNTLQRQIENGAPADLFFSAAAAPAKALVENSWVMRDQLFVMWTTDLVILGPVESGAAETVDPETALRGARRLAIGDLGVPVGEYGRDALASLGLADEMKGRLVPLSNEAAVVQAVVTGACDRGLAYASSVAGGRHAETLQVLSVLPYGSHPPITYYGAILASSPHADAITQFLLYLTAGEGATILEDAGFRAPVAPVHPDPGP